MTVPAVLALTWAKTSGLLIFSASRIRLLLFQAGVTDVKIQGVLAVSESASCSYQPTPKPSPTDQKVLAYSDGGQWKGLYHSNTCR